MVDKEWKEVCDNCRKKAKARVFYKKIQNQWIWLCSACWELF